MIVYMSDSAQSQGCSPIRATHPWKPIVRQLVTGVLLLVASPSWGQNPPADWQAQVRKYSQMKDWASAMRIVDQEIARAPEDMDVRAWRARVLEWSGNLADA